MGNVPRMVWMGICRLSVTGVIAAAIACLLLEFTSDRNARHAAAATAWSASTQGSSDQPARDISDANGLSAAFRRAVQKALPAVVVIKASPSPVCPRCGRAHESYDGDVIEGGFDGVSPRSLEVLGSGFIVAPSGVVLTNKHVVRGIDRLVVQTVDGRQFTVDHVTTDREQDAAILHITADTPLPFIGLGDSNAMQIGDWVLTIGCPLELDQTVSAGIISAKDRSFCTHHRARYLQTDAVVNPGSSGGPLVDLNGMAVGVATALASEDGGFQGIGFAIPASLLKKLVANAMESHPQEAASLSSKKGT